MSLSVPSLVSPTRPLTDRTLSLPGCAIVQRTTASSAAPTDSVLVRTIGVSIVPSSSTCVDPASLPNALPTKTAPGHLLAEQVAAVRQDRGDAGADRVALDERRRGRRATPATSVIALSGPGVPAPGAMPRSRARGRDWLGSAEPPRR